MPLYDYRCEACEHTFEKLVRRAGQKVKCEACGSPRTRRVPSTFALRGPSPLAPMLGRPDSRPVGGCCGIDPRT